MGILALVGTGTMGTPIGHCLLAAGHDLRVTDRSHGATDSLVSAGAIAATDAAQAASGVDGVFLSLPGPAEVEAATTGTGGVLEAAIRPAWVVDLSTNSPTTVRRLRQRCSDAGVAFVDAPVSGGRPKAETGTLSVMVGADADEHAAVAPYLRCFGENVFHVGPSGAGTIAKLVNNQLFLAGAVLLQEAYLLAAAAGLDPSDLHPIIRASSGATYAALAPMLLRRNVEDVNFRLDIAAKDLALAVGMADELGLPLAATRAASELYDAAIQAGLGAADFHATMLQLESDAGIVMPALQRREAVA